MKIKWILVALAIGTLSTGYSQQLKTEWSLTEGGVRYDQTNAVDIDADGNIYVTGYFQHEATYGNTTVTSSGDTDIYIAKYNKNGKLQWIRTGGSDYSRKNVISEYGTALASGPDGSIYVAGSFCRTAIFDREKVQTAGKDDIFIAKYTTDGTLAWLKSAGGASQDRVTSLASDAQGNLYITGYYQNTATFEQKPLSAGEFSNFFIAKYNAEGNLLWIRDSKQTGDAIGKSICIYNDDVFVAGNFRGKFTLDKQSVESSGEDDIFIARIQDNGECAILFKKGEAGIENVNSMDVTKEGIFLTGWYQSDNGWNRNLFVAMTSTSGDQGWIKKIKGQYNNEGTAIRSIGPDQVVVSASFQTEIRIDDMLSKASAAGNALIAEFNKKGNLKWMEALESTGQKRINGLAIDENGYTALVGMVTSDPTEPTVNTLGKSDAFLSKIQIPVKGDRDENDPVNMAKIFPNPSNGQFNISYDFGEQKSITTVTVMDITGKAVYQRSVPDVQRVNLSVSLPDVSTGVYNVLIKSDDFELYKKIVIK